MTADQITALLPLARTIAAHYARAYRDPDEMESAAVLGLIAAARTWKPSGGMSAARWARLKCAAACVDVIRGVRGYRRRHRPPTVRQFRPRVEIEGVHTEPEIDRVEARDNSPSVVVNELLAALPAADARLVRDHYIGGYTLAECGARIGIHESNAKRRIGRLLAQLREMI